MQFGILSVKRSALFIILLLKIINFTLYKNVHFTEKIYFKDKHFLLWYKKGDFVIFIEKAILIIIIIVINTDIFYNLNSFTMNSL